MTLHGKLGLAMVATVGLAAMASAPRCAWGQDCVWEQASSNPPWQVSDMRIEASWSSIFGSFSNGLCPRSCSFKTNARFGNTYLSGGPCPEYMGNNDPRYLAWIFWFSNRIEFRETWNSWVSSAGSLSITFTPYYAASISVPDYEVNQGWTIVGGEVTAASGWMTRFIRAGEEVTVSRTWSFDGSFSDAYFFEWGGCDDYNSNGTCDLYENLARNFGDFDASGDVGASDLATMLSAWGSSGGSDGVIDLDNDGIVGASDLGILLSRWGLGA